MKDKAEIIFILNPLSGDGITGRKWPEIEALLKRLGFRYRLVREVGDLGKKVVEVLNEGVESGTVIAGVGGDGTHCAIINGIMKFKNENPSATVPSYSIIPLGTANNMAKSFGIGCAGDMIGSNLVRALKGTIYGADFRIDIGFIGKHFFVDDFSVGFDAHVLAGREKDKKLIAGNKLARAFVKGYSIYFLNVIKGLSAFSPVQIRVEADSKEVYDGKAFNIVINNTRIYAGEFDFTDSAVANDGLLDMLVFTGRCDYLRRYITGSRHMHHALRRIAHRNSELIQHVKAESFNISISKSLTFQTDGEVIGESDNIRIGVIPGAISIKIPVEPA